MSSPLSAGGARHLAVALSCLAAAGCQEAPVAAKPPATVHVQSVTAAPRLTSVSLTGEIRARVQSDLSFRFAGRIASRSVEIGERVQVGQVLATLDTSEQVADVNSATAGLQSAEATLRQANSTFERQKTLLSNGYTTQTSYDNANQALLAARSSLESAKVTLATAQDQLAYTALKADGPGVITARNAEAGQVIEAAQAVFTIARDGGRDAVFDIYETLLTQKPADDSVTIRLLSNPAIEAVGKVREVSPTIDPTMGTVRVKIGIDQPPPEMGLGVAVAGVGRFQSQDVVTLPWTAFFTQGERPAVWTVEPQTNVATLRPVTVESYRSGELLLRGGVKPGELVVTAGAQLLRPGEVVTPVQAAAGETRGAVK